MSTKSARFSALRSLGVWAADAPQLAGETEGRIPPRSELVIVSEVEAVAKRKLDPAVGVRVEFDCGDLVRLSVCDTGQPVHKRFHPLPGIEINAQKNRFGEKGKTFQ